MRGLRVWLVLALGVGLALQGCTSTLAPSPSTMSALPTLSPGSESLVISGQSVDGILGVASEVFDRSFTFVISTQDHPVSCPDKPNNDAAIVACNDGIVIIPATVTLLLSAVPGVAVWFIFGQAIAQGLGYDTDGKSACAGGYFVAKMPGFSTDARDALLEYFGAAHKLYGYITVGLANGSYQNRPLTDCLGMV